LTDGFGDSWNCPNVEIDEEEVKRRAREREEQRKCDEESRIRRNYKSAVKPYTRILKMPARERPENWWKDGFVTEAWRIFFFKIEDRCYGKPVIVPRRVKATVEHLCKNGRAYRLSTCVKECWNCGGSSPGCGLTLPSN
jgi:hypothetical protein